MYELRTDWSDAINKAIQDGNPITNYNGSQTYSYEDLDKNRDGKIDSITVIYKNTTQNIVITALIRFGTIRIMQTMWRSILAMAGCFKANIMYRS